MLACAGSRLALEASPRGSGHGNAARCCLRSGSGSSKAPRHSSPVGVLCVDGAPRSPGGSGSHAAVGEGSCGETQPRRKLAHSKPQGRARRERAGWAASPGAAGSPGRGVAWAAGYALWNQGERRPESGDRSATPEPGTLREAEPVDPTLTHASVGSGFPARLRDCRALQPLASVSFPSKVCAVEWWSWKRDTQRPLPGRDSNLKKICIFFSIPEAGFCLFALSPPT